MRTIRTVLAVALLLSLAAHAAIDGITNTVINLTATSGHMGRK